MGKKPNAQFLLEATKQDYIDYKRSLGTQNMSLFKSSQRVKALSNALAFQRRLPT